jgi:DNA-binding response OmpR family regulator
MLDITVNGAEPSPSLVLVDSSDAAVACREVLSAHFRVTHVTAATPAIKHLRRTPITPEYVVTELSLPDRTGLDVCRAAKRLPLQPTVLVTTSAVHQVRDALLAGCDSILLKPFPPNLLVSRLCRLKRVQSQTLRRRAAAARSSSHRIRETSLRLLRRLTDCPYCHHEVTVRLGDAGYLRTWYQCVACHAVWPASRPR